MRAAWSRMNAILDAETTEGVSYASDARWRKAWDEWADLAEVQRQQEELAGRIMQSRRDRLLYAIYGGPSERQRLSQMRRAYHHKRRGHR